MTALAACALVILGTLELISPTRPRAVRRYPRATARRSPLSLSPGPHEDTAAAEPAASRPATPAPAPEPPIERLLRVQAADLIAGGPVVPAVPDRPARARRAVGRRTRAVAEDRTGDVVSEAADLAERGDFAGARQVIGEALDDPRCPEAGKAQLREALAAFAAREAGQLTADAIRRIDAREDEAMAALVQAEDFLVALPEEMLAPRRRRELERRLWWGYTKLGTRRAERARWDEALEPLLRALAFHQVGPERHEETREQLARAVGGLVDARAAMVVRLTEAGDREGARAVWEMLRAVLDTAVDRGLAPDALEAARSRMDALVEHVGAGR
jgi:hypothetical protein